MPNPVRRLNLARPVMSRNAMKENRLQRGICHQIRRFRHLCLSRLGRPDRDDDPLHPGFAHNACLIDILGIIDIDRRQRDDRFDSLTLNDPPQRPRPLPSASNNFPRHDNRNSLLKKIVPKVNQKRRYNRAASNDSPSSQAPRHSPIASLRQGRLLCVSSRNPARLLDREL